MNFLSSLFASLFYWLVILLIGAGLTRNPHGAYDAGYWFAMAIDAIILIGLWFRSTQGKGIERITFRIVYGEYYYVPYLAEMVILTLLWLSFPYYIPWIN